MSQSQRLYIYPLDSVKAPLWKLGDSGLPDPAHIQLEIGGDVSCNTVDRGDPPPEYVLTGSVIRLQVSPRVSGPELARWLYSEGAQIRLKGLEKLMSGPGPFCKEAVELVGRLEDELALLPQVEVVTDPTRWGPQSAAKILSSICRYGSLRSALEHTLLCEAEDLMVAMTIEVLGKHWFDVLARGAAVTKSGNVHVAVTFSRDASLEMPPWTGEQLATEIGRGEGFTHGDLTVMPSHVWKFLLWPSLQ